MTDYKNDLKNGKVSMMLNDLISNGYDYVGAMFVICDLYKI